MLMVDEMLYIDCEKVITSFFIKPDCIFVENGKMQEVGLIENSAQTCSAIVGKSYFDEDDTQGHSNKLVGFISVIKSINIYNLPSVGDEIITHSNLISKFDADNYTICTMSCEIQNKGEKIAEFVMNLFIQEV